MLVRRLPHVFDPCLTHSSSFNAPGRYTIFGKVTKGMDVLHKLEALPTKREGIFVM